jgi:hypothetical protein
MDLYTEVLKKRTSAQYERGSKVAGATDSFNGRSRDVAEAETRQAVIEAYTKEFGPIDWQSATVTVVHATGSVSVELVTWP